MIIAEKDDLSPQVLLSDLIENILRYADNPGACAKHVTIQIRELIGVRLVAIVSEEREGHDLIGICPPRREPEWHQPEIQAFISRVSEFHEPRMIDPATDSAAASLSSIGIGPSFVIPLMIGAERMGMLVLLDLLDKGGASDIFKTLIRISPILALILKNSFLYKNLEKTVQARTEQLARSEELFRALFEQASDGIFFFDVRGTLIMVNESFARLHGYTVAEMLQLGLKGLNVAGTAHLPERLSRIMAGEHLTFEVEHVHKDGHIIPLEVAANLISSGGEQLIIAIHRDITERKRTAAEKAELEAKQLQLQKAESLNRLAGAIAHHFNNHLQAVMGNLEMAMDDMPACAGAPAALTEALKAAGKASEMSRLMLTYLGQPFGKQVPLDLSETCRQCLNLLQSTAPKGMILKTDFPAFGPIIRGNAGQIQQILTNLVTNALEAGPGNQATIGLAVKTVTQADIPASKRFPVDWQPHESTYACLEVTDTGSGIADEDIAKLFDPFYSSKFVGRGMGLSVVLGILRAHGGGITVESMPGRGSVFRVFLPVTLEQAPSHTDKAARPIENQGGGTVLLIEDEEPVRNMAAIMLTRLGFTVIEAADGVEAVAIFQQHRNEIRCVLTDLTMPHMNGWETLTALRKISPDIPVILTSGYDEARVMADEHPERPDAFLGKPYLFKGLSDTIRRVLANKLDIQLQEREVFHGRDKTKHPLT